MSREVDHGFSWLNFTDLQKSIAAGESQTLELKNCTAEKKCTCRYIPLNVLTRVIFLCKKLRFKVKDTSLSGNKFINLHVIYYRYSLAHRDVVI